MPKIAELFAYVVQDKDENDEGIMAIRHPDGGWIPLVGADRDRMIALRPQADIVALATRKPYRIMRFELKEEITLDGD